MSKNTKNNPKKEEQNIETDVQGTESEVQNPASQSQTESAGEEKEFQMTISTNSMGNQGLIGKSNKGMLFAGIAIVLLLISAAVFILLKRKKWENEEMQQKDDFNMRNINEGTVANVPEGTLQQYPRIVIGKVHHIGRRKYQQDCLGVTEIAGGVLAVVADGMGGLADGDKVSQKIVMTALGDADKINPAECDNPLYVMAAHANSEVNRMIGVNRQYKSGSTMLAVAANQEGFHWLSIGDSRIYLYRGGRLLQLNREHIYEAELLCEAVNGEISFAEVKNDSQRNGLTSFIGMGELKHIDGSIRKCSVQKGDMVLLMSDGVFNTISDTEIESILANAGDMKTVETVLERMVLEKQNPKQDNFTAVILEFL